MNDYDQIYAREPQYFGDQPDGPLVRFAGRIRPGGRVLDLGVGQGRNALPLARLGYRLTGIDASGVALDQVREGAGDLGQSGAGKIERLWRGDIFEYTPGRLPFDAILAFGLMPTLSRTQCASLLHRFYTWSAPGSVLMLTAWHVDDPLYEFVSEEWTRVGLHSFRSADGQFRTYLARHEITNLLPGWEIVHHHEGLGPRHRHGDGEAHRHGVVEVVAVRRDEVPARLGIRVPAA